MCEDSIATDEDENKPVWPTWAVGVLSKVREVIKNTQQLILMRISLFGQLGL
jgi:hypothetical protein